ncbi:MAG: hypothetical protein HY710_10300 [Candidatus Latescibacteria bacterium]|nr:hypothetical protein [Candidatus Latescibacterota bacterium]
MSISLLREITEQVRPPRALYVPYAMGYPLGEPNNPALQRRIIERAFALFDRPSGPVLEEW